MGTFYRVELLKALGLAQAQGRVLDVGGYDGFLLSQMDNCQRYSVDIDTDAKYDGIAYCRGDGLNLPFGDDSFDAIFALDVLEHVDNEERFAGELVRVLKPGGRLILSTPQDDIRIFPKAMMPWVNRSWQHHRTPGYTREAVTTLFETLKPAECSVRKLSSWWFLNLYLPLSGAWRLLPRIGPTLLRAVAGLDGRRTGPRGYLLAEVRK